MGGAARVQVEGYAGSSERTADNIRIVLTILIEIRVSELFKASVVHAIHHIGVFVVVQLQIELSGQVAGIEYRRVGPVGPVPGDVHEPGVVLVNDAGVAEPVQGETGVVILREVVNRLFVPLLGGQGSRQGEGGEDDKGFFIAPPPTLRINYSPSSPCQDRSVKKGGPPTARISFSQMSFYV